MFSTQSYLFYLYSRWRTNFDMLFARILPNLKPKIYDLEGKTAIVTGANVGIGLEISRTLAEFGAKIILACRSKEKAEMARLDIVENSKGKVLYEQVEVLVLDCGDLESVRKFVTSIGERRVDILVNNAGLTMGAFVKSKQGFETTYATNFLSHFLLTLLLLPNINKDGRIVNVSSVGNYNVNTRLDLDDLDMSKHLEGKQGFKNGDSLDGTTTMELYARTKLMQVMFTREMQRRLDASGEYAVKRISVHSFHPGMVKSQIWDRDEGLRLSWKKYLLAFVNFFGVSTQQGAATGVHLATSEDAVMKRGMYWERMELRGPHRLVEDEVLRRRMWEMWKTESDFDDSGPLNNLKL